MRAGLGVMIGASAAGRDIPLAYGLTVSEVGIEERGRIFRSDHESREGLPTPVAESGGREYGFVLGAVVSTGAFASGMIDLGAGRGCGGMGKAKGGAGARGQTGTGSRSERGPLGGARGGSDDDGGRVCEI